MSKSPIDSELRKKEAEYVASVWKKNEEGNRPFPLNRNHDDKPTESV